MNYISDHTSKTHDYTIVGWLTTTVVIDAGLDADHEKYAQTQTARHEYEQYVQPFPSKASFRPSC